MNERPIDDVPRRGEGGYWDALREESRARDAADARLREELSHLEAKIVDALAAIPRETAKLADTSNRLLATSIELRHSAGRGWLWNFVLIVAVLIGSGSLVLSFGHHWMASHPGTALRLGQLEERTSGNARRIDQHDDIFTELRPRLRRLERLDIVEEVIGHRPGSPTMPPATDRPRAAPKTLEQEVDVRPQPR